MSHRTRQTQEKIESIVREKLLATHVEIEDESWKHAGHASAGGGGHFQMIIVSPQFEGVNLMNRNRLVFETLQELMKSEIHALSIKAKTPDEWIHG
ncbi:MAG: BolA family transcriptional regulator [Nitrospirae bacterium]|nr:BolA family transcriptional regulator [Nitrospirota bacterium]MBI3595046.1 BolA family transcriptional regulator [Nitrospirota bacterium]